MAYGLTAEGFDIKPVEVIKEDMETATRLAFGASIPLGEKTLFGHQIGLVSAAIGEVWEVTQDIVASDDPDAATGDRLAAVGAITGTTPLPEKKSTVVVTLTGDPSTVVDALSRMKTASTDKEFATVEDATIVATDAFAVTTAYIVGDRVTSTANIYICITAGTSGASLAGIGEDITSGTAHFRHIGEGTGDIDVEAQSVIAGEIEAASSDLIDIVTPISGWLGVKNLTDATLGRAAETDAEFRVRRQAELSTGGSTPINALRADLLQVTGVTSASIFVNFTNVTNGDGMPPKSVEALVRGGDEQDIYDQLLDSVAVGIETHGTEIGAAIDSEGNSHVMKFSRPDEIEIWLELTLTYDALKYPDDGNDQVAAAIVEFGSDFVTGHNAYPSAIAAQAFQVAGVLNVSAILVDTVDPPVGTTTVAIALRELATFATARITINSSAATP